MKLLPAAVVFFAAQFAFALDVHVELQNDYVSVERVKVDNHEFLMGPGPDRIIVFITDALVRVTQGNGTPKEIQAKAGDVIDTGGGALSGPSGHPIEFAVIHLQPKRVPPSIVKLDPVRIDPKYHSVVFENDRVRAIRTVLEPGIKSPLHEHPPYVVVYITELHTTMKLADGKEVDNPRKAGDIAWRDFMRHETLNIGKQTAVEIQVEMK